MISQELVKSIFDYDPNTGLFVHKNRPIEMFSTEHYMRSWNTRFSGKQTGTKAKHGYVFLSINGKLYTAHRVAFLYCNGYLPVQVDHINGVRDDNRIDNLRAADNGKNQWNINAKVGTKLGLKGVSECVSRKGIVEGYRSRIWHKGVLYYLGRFHTAELAHEAYRMKEKELRSDWVRFDG